MFQEHQELQSRVRESSNPEFPYSPNFANSKHVSITLTELPNFPSYTSGHATFSGAAASVLSYLFPHDKTTFDSLAKEAANSRLFGGIHYRFDNDSGLACGYRIGNLAVERGKNDGSH
ncbi:MAG: phosphatase PAP2 family protein [Armatimonadetes bacterium]|nr:phosphatase PAP2 family protein [Armatimonadota bacterium]